MYFGRSHNRSVFVSSCRCQDLVDLGLVQVVDDIGAIEEAAVAGLGTAQVLAALLDVVGTGQVGLGDAAESAAAC